MKKLFIFTFILIFFTGCGNSSGRIDGVQNIKANHESSLQIAYLDIGQGDATLINTPENRQILVDGGHDQAILEKLSRYLDWDDKYIDVVVLTHPHADHIDGLVDVLKRYQVGEIWMTGVVHTSSKYLEFLNLINDNNINTKIIDHKHQIEFEPNINITFLWPNKSLAGKTADNLNNTSVTFILDYLENSFLFTGDIEKETEAEIVASVPTSSPIDILKVAHHGSSSSSIQEFLDLFNPKYAVISSGKDNPYGHPSPRTLRRLERMDIEIFRTDEVGDIMFISDGINLTH